MKKSAANPTPSAVQYQRQRAVTWRTAGLALEAAGRPMTRFLSITWSAIAAADPHHSILLALPENERVKLLWDRTRRLTADHGEEEWIAARAPEYDTQKHLHLHMGFRLPEKAAADRAMVALIERLSGVDAEHFWPEGRTLKRHGRTSLGVIAVGYCGAWMLQKNIRLGSGGTNGLMTYVTKAPRASETSAQFRLSNDLRRIAGGRRP